MVLLAKRRGLIPAARPILEKMRLAGMFISEGLLTEALSLVVE